ncbi:MULTISPECIES: phage head closure protein [Pseudomonas]|uniref:phage head closure protein n=1 Tax=Pseudomonas TaxID=286 RepID=UPI001070FE58|nr:MULTISPECIES: phage head closure protein [Pseudomonas]QBR32833.1 head-tail adaptor protein [Pseudomonas sp. S150]UZT91015.1 phage head closure protein [Pseudomonas koreensis]
MRAGRLRHRIDFEEKALVQDPNNGEMIQGWRPVRERVPADFEPLSSKDLFAAQAAQSQATCRFVIRHWAGLLPTMRIVHRGKVYSIEGEPLPDRESGLEYLTILTKTGVNDG